MTETYHGNYWFSGTTQVKKTTHANALAWRARDALGWGIIVIDHQRAWNFREYRHVKTRSELYAEVYGRRGVCAFTPMDPENDAEDVSAIYRVVAELGKVIVLMDEAFFALNRRRMIRQVSIAMRTYAHHGALLLFTTQKYGDIHDDALAVQAEIRVYQTLPGKDQDRLWEERRIDAEEVENLRVGQYLKIINGKVQRGADGLAIVYSEA